MAKKYIASIDLGGTNLKIALLDCRYKIIARNYLSTQSFTRKNQLIHAIVSSVNRIIQSNNLKKDAILGLGLGLPGPIDVKKGLVHFFPNIPGWKEVRIRELLQSKLKLPVFIDNDANLMALAEFRLGAAKGTTNAVCITLGTGVGGGIILEGKLYRGASFAAGEIGHLPINENGPSCGCGGKACLESYIGNKRITVLIKKVFGRDIPLDKLSQLAGENNKKAIGVWRQVALHLGIALTGVVNLLNPDVIVLGGGVSGAGKILFDRVRLIVASRAMSVQAKHVKIVRAKLGPDAGLIGAAILVQEKEEG